MIRRPLALLAALAAGCGLMLGGGAVAYAGKAAPSAAGAQRVMPGGPIIRAHRSGSSAKVRGASTPPTISLNWSGYAATAQSPFNYVHSQFTQPAITCRGVKNQWTSNWVGLDGYTDATVEQDGTFATCGGKHSRTPEYFAWYELYPQASVEVFPVTPGDRISATVRYTGGKFHLRIADLTTGMFAGTSATCSTCQRSSAEWIVERPALCNNSLTKCFLTELADFHSTTMSDDTARTDGGSIQGVSDFVNTPIYMVDLLKKGFISLDTVGPIDSSTQSFTATWDRSGKPTPIQL